MFGTISSTVTQGITLSVNPTTITASGVVKPSTGAGVTGVAHPWTLGNAGIVTATGSGADGIILGAGGSIDNTGAIAGYHNGINILGAVGTVSNSGTLDSSITKIVAGAPVAVYEGVFLGAGGTVVNTASGVIFGGIGGIGIDGGRGTVSNAGDIHVTTLQGNGVTLERGGAVANLAGGHITGNFGGVIIYGDVATVTNAGTISALYLGGYGVYLGGGGAVTNFAGGSILGADNGVLGGDSTPLTFTNAGYVYGGQTAVSLGTGSFVTNTGTIFGAGAGVAVAGGTVVNAGLIRAANTAGTAVRFGAGAADRLIVDPGASFIGAVRGGGSGSVLELATGSGANLLAGLGGTITNFATIAFDKGAQWELDGSLAAFDAGQTITGFAQGDTIRLTGVTGLTGSFDSKTDQLTLTGNGQSDVLQFDGALADETIMVQAQGSDTLLTIMPCFAAGTRIATPNGETKVECLREGDLVLTLSGLPLPVVWIGRRQVDCVRHREPERVRPVRIAAHAFAEQEPHRDLLLSPDHAILVQDVLVPVKHLIDEHAIRQIALPTVEYFHIELPTHAIILAEGLPAESYLDLGDRSAFLDGAAPIPLHPFFGGMEDVDHAMRRELLCCAPFRITGPEVEEARALLAARRALLPISAPPEREDQQMHSLV